MTPPEGEYPKTVVLRDGAHLVLRPWTSADAAALHACAAGIEPVPGGIVVVAWDGDRAAGAARLSPAGAGAVAVAVVLEPAYAGRRLGTWLLLDAVHLAAGLGLTRLVVEPPPAAADYRAALDRLDFMPAGGTTEAPARLVKTLHHGWTDF
ncbi:MAG TPA: GNAT family N-acetyltransferase [Candidatus Binatia bacterium]|nr:GNAT family N-acetyltransferase [Candidatus Binatia bacterium]